MGQAAPEEESASMREQRGYLVRKKGGWYFKYRDYQVQPDGTVTSQQVFRKIAPYDERYHCREDVKPLVQEILSRVNGGRANPESTMPLQDFWESIYLPELRRDRRPATVRSYSQTWAILKAYAGEMRLRDFRCCDGERILADINREKGPLARSSLRRLKAVLSVLFKVARRKGLLDSPNPIVDVSIPKGKDPAETYAYSLDEIVRMLRILPDPAATAIAVAAFAGLGLSELRGLRWEDYSGAEITVRRSVWAGKVGTDEGLHITDPKTPKRKAPIPIIGLLAKRLDEYRFSQGNPATGWVFASPSGGPLHFGNLVNRTIKPALTKAKLQWHGWHAFRRGLGTNLYTLGTADKTVQRILRHADVATTMAYYVKPVPEDTVRAMQALDRAVSALPVQ